MLNSLRHHATRPPSFTGDGSSPAALKRSSDDGEIDKYAAASTRPSNAGGKRFGLAGDFFMASVTGGGVTGVIGRPPAHAAGER